MSSRTTFTGVILGAMLFGTSACSDQVTDAASPDALSSSDYRSTYGMTMAVAIDSSSLTAGERATATAILRDSHGNIVTGKTIQWSSADTTVASVASSGIVTAKSPGTSSIVASYRTVKGSAPIAVATGVAAPARVASVGVTIASPAVTVGQTTQAAADLRDSTGAPLSGRAVTWSSSNTSVASVSSTGVITSLAAGSSNIIATSESKSGSATLTVMASAPAPVTSVGVSLGASSLSVGQTTQATATLRDTSGNVLTGRVITWSSSNPSLATVSSSGVVTAVAAGSPRITATSEGRSGSATITVTAVAAPPSSTEPDFVPSTDVMLLGAKDGTFDSYASTSTLASQFSTNGTLIAPGRNGSAHAVRLTYVPSGTGVEPMQYLGASWARQNHVVASFYFRTSVGADPTSGRFDYSGFKWLILRRDGNAGDPNGRITAGVHSLQQGFQYGTPDNGVQFTVNDQSVTTGGFWQNMSKSIGWNSTNAKGATNRATPINDGNWHRYTIEADPYTNTVRVWVDGTLIISSAAVNYPMYDQGWDEIGLGQNVVPDLLAGFGFTLDYDDLRVWSRKP